MLIYANYQENEGVNLIFLCVSKEAYRIVRQLENINGQKSASESSKMREKQMLAHWNPPGHSVLRIRSKGDNLENHYYLCVDVDYPSS